jgi:acetyltransferase-like isoleucine patch superfamily enzyme
MAVVQTDDIGDNVIIHEFAVVRRGVRIGNNVVIHPHVVIESDVTIGDNVEIFPGTYIGKVPKGAGALARTPIFAPDISIGRDCALGPNAVIYCDVEIGVGTLIGDGASIREQCKIGDHCVVGRYVTIGYNTIIGDRVKIMDLSHVVGKSIVGNDVFISMCVGTSNDNALGKNGYDEDRIWGAKIEDGAAIGLGASLLPNITIGAHAIVGAGALVSKDVKPDSLVMGVPAREIKIRG